MNGARPFDTGVSKASQRVLTGESKDAEDFLPLLKCIRDFFRDERGPSGMDYRFEKGGAIGFYRAKRSPQQDEGRLFTLGLRIFPLDERIPLGRSDVGLADIRPKALSAIDNIGSPEVAELYKIDRPSQALLHFEHVKRLVDTHYVSKTEKPHETTPGDDEKYLIEVPDATPDELAGLVHEGECEDGQKRTQPPSDYEDFLSRLAYCGRCVGRYKEIIGDAVSGTLSDIPSDDDLIPYKALNALDFTFFTSVPKKLAVIVLPFVTSPAAIVVLPWTDSAEVAKDLAEALLAETKGVVYTQVYSTLIDNLSGHNISGTNHSDAIDLLKDYTRRLVEILMPIRAYTEFDGKHNERPLDWPVSGSFGSTNNDLKDYEIEIAKVKYKHPQTLDPLAVSTFYTHKFFADIVYQTDTPDHETGSPHEKEAVELMLPKLFSMIYKDWDNARMSLQRYRYSQYQPVKDDLDSIIKSINFLRDTATRVEERLNPANVGFLSVGPQLESLFRDDTALWWRPDPDSGNVLLRTSDPAVDVAEKASDWNRLQTSHSSDSISPSTWEAYKKYLQAKGQATAIALLQAFGAEGKAEGKAEGEAEGVPARHEFRLFKLLFHRPHFESCLYPAQLAVSAVTALARDQSHSFHDHGLVWASDHTSEPHSLWRRSSVPPISQFSANETPLQQNDDFPQMLSSVCKTFPHWVDSASSGSSVMLPEGVSVASVLGSLMKLVGTELDSRNHVNRSVKFRSMRVHVPKDGVTELVIGCTGAFDPSALSQLRFLGENASAHGLRSSLRTMCDAVNQRNPRVCTWGDINKRPGEARSTTESLRSFSEQCGDRFLIVTDPEKGRDPSGSVVTGLGASDIPNGDPVADPMTQTVFYVRFAETGSHSASKGSSRLTAGRLFLFNFEDSSDSSERVQVLQRIAGPDDALELDRLNTELGQPSKLIEAIRDERLVFDQSTLAFIHHTQWPSFLSDIDRHDFIPKDKLDKLQILIYQGSWDNLDSAESPSDLQEKVNAAWPDHVHVLLGQFPPQGSERPIERLIRRFREETKGSEITSEELWRALQEALRVDPEWERLLDAVRRALDSHDTDPADVVERWCATLGIKTYPADGKLYASAIGLEGAKSRLHGLLDGRDDGGLRTELGRILNNMKGPDPASTSDGMVQLRPPLPQIDDISRSLLKSYYGTSNGSE